MSISAISGIASLATGLASSLTSSKSNASNPVADFMDYMKKSPAERFQESWLSAHGISKEAFDAMPPAEKQKILAQMKQDLEAKIKDQAANQSNPNRPTKTTAIDIFA